MIHLYTLFLYLFYLSSLFLPPLQSVYVTNNGEIQFLSNAPLEVIEARSVAMSGAINISNRTFAFTIPINTFQGFNNGLQREHFNDKYMESHKFPSAFFKGKIIEEIDWNVPGTYQVRAKGFLSVRGIEVERIIKVTITITANKITATCKFDIPLADYKITIPKILNQKIADKIEVKVHASFSPK